jgi:DNA repair protein RecN (Recombination protein N)
VADVVGKRLRQLGARYQVLCITHLPQIAAYGEAHFSITKRVQSGRTLTAIAPVAGEARERELARMIAGTEPTTAVRTSAREMLAARGESEIKAKAKAKRASDDEPMPRREPRSKRPEVRGT